jgi:hypothetical protein
VLTVQPDLTLAPSPSSLQPPFATAFASLDSLLA